MHTSPLLVENFTAYDTAAARSAYANAEPFPHGVVSPIADPLFLVACRTELEDALGFTPKETDLYSLQQSPDLANLTSLDEVKVPHLVRLREELYSAAFREKIAQHTGCGTLSDTVDLAAALYTNGSHLLVHDDVVSTRRIAFIIYLTKEEDSWCESDGGCLELYPRETSPDGHPVPHCKPQRRLLPLFNRFAFFTVTPGQSFHAVQEVYAASKERFSLQGWFHCSDVASLRGAELSLKQLRSLASNETFESYSIPVPKLTEASKGTKKTNKKSRARGEGGALPSVDISDDVLNELRTLGVHPMYLDRENLGVMILAMKKEGMVQMGQFLVEELVNPIVDAIRRTDDMDGLGLGQPTPPNDDSGITAEWERVGPPHVRRYLQLRPEVSGMPLKKQHAELPETEESDDRVELTQMLRCIKGNLVESAAFATFVAAVAAAVIGRALGERSTAVRRYRPGLDFSLATVPAETIYLDSRITFCADPLPDDDEASDDDDKEEEDSHDDDEEEEDLWRSCEVGGFDSYIKVASDSTGGTIMATDRDAAINIPCQNNTLSIALRRPDAMHFVKYLQAAAPSSRYEVSCVFKLPPPSESPSAAAV